MCASTARFYTLQSNTYAVLMASVIAGAEQELSAGVAAPGVAAPAAVADMSMPFPTATAPAVVVSIVDRDAPQRVTAIDALAQDKRQTQRLLARCFMIPAVASTEQGDRFGTAPARGCQKPKNGEHDSYICPFCITTYGHVQIVGKKNPPQATVVVDIDGTENQFATLNVLNLKVVTTRKAHGNSAGITPRTFNQPQNVTRHMLSEHPEIVKAVAELNTEASANDRRDRPAQADSSSNEQRATAPAPAPKGIVQWTSQDSRRRLQAVIAEHLVASQLPLAHAEAVLSLLRAVLRTDGLQSAVQDKRLSVSHYFMRQAIGMQFDNALKELKAELAEAEAVSVSFDAWSTMQLNKEMAGHAYFIGKRGSVQVVFIGMRTQLNQIGDAKSLVAVIDGMLKDVGLVRTPRHETGALDIEKLKVFGYVSDAGPPMPRLGRELDLTRVQCFVHKLAKVLERCFACPEVKPAVEATTACASHVRTSTKRVQQYRAKHREIANAELQRRREHRAQGVELPDAEDDGDLELEPIEDIAAGMESAVDLLRANDDMNVELSDNEGDEDDEAEANGQARVLVIGEDGTATAVDVVPAQPIPPAPLNNGSAAAEFARGRTHGQLRGAKNPGIILPGTSKIRWTTLDTQMRRVSDEFEPILRGVVDAQVAQTFANMHDAIKEILMVAFQLKSCIAAFQAPLISAAHILPTLRLTLLPFYADNAKPFLAGANANNEQFRKAYANWLARNKPRVNETSSWETGANGMPGGAILLTDAGKAMRRKIHADLLVVLSKYLDGERGATRKKNMAMGMPREKRLWQGAGQGQSVDTTTCALATYFCPMYDLLNLVSSSALDDPVWRLAREAVRDWICSTLYRAAINRIKSEIAAATARITQPIVMGMDTGDSGARFDDADDDGDDGGGGEPAAKRARTGSRHDAGSSALPSFLMAQVKTSADERPTARAQGGVLNEMSIIQEMRDLVYRNEEVLLTAIQTALAAFEREAASFRTSPPRDRPRTTIDFWRSFRAAAVSRPGPILTVDALGALCKDLLATLALKFETIMATTVADESAFSVFGRDLDSSRLSSSSQLIEQRAVVGRYLKRKRSIASTSS